MYHDAQVSVFIYFFGDFACITFMIFHSFWQHFASFTYNLLNFFPQASQWNFTRNEHSPVIPSQCKMIWQMIMILTTFFSLETTRKMVKNVVFNAFGRLYCSVLTGLYSTFALYVNSTKRQTHQSSVYVAIKCKISLPGLCTKQANGICCYFFRLFSSLFFSLFFHMNLIFFFEHQ